VDTAYKLITTEALITALDQCRDLIQITDSHHRIQVRRPSSHQVTEQSNRELYLHMQCVVYHSKPFSFIRRGLSSLVNPYKGFHEVIIEEVEGPEAVNQLPEYSGFPPQSITKIMG